MNFLYNYFLEVMDNIAIGFGSVAIFLMLSLGSYSADALIEQAPGAAVGVFLFVVIWSFIVSLMGTLIRSLGMLKKTEAGGGAA